jgi:hypothetical protein
LCLRRQRPEQLSGSDLVIKASRAYTFYVSKAAIGQALELLRELPDSDQEAVLQFLKTLKTRVDGVSSSAPDSNSALQYVDGLLVFTGKLAEPETDWLKVFREEHDQQFLLALAGPDAPQ